MSSHALRPLLAAVLAVLLVSCKGDGPTQGGGNKPGPAAQVSVASGSGQTATVGTKLPSPLVVRVTDAGGRAVSGATVAWAVSAGGGSLSAGSATTDAAGEARTEWTLGTAAGDNGATATVAGVAPAAFTATGTAGAAARIEKVSGDGQTAAASSTVGSALVVKVTDAHGNPVGGASVAWQVTAGGGSLAPTTPATDAAGAAEARWTLGGAAGDNRATATAAGATVNFSATATPPGSSLAVQSIAPATLLPGGTATLTGSGFAAAPGENAVTVDGVPVTVTAASATQLTLTLPPRAAFRCEPTRGVTVSVAAGGATGARSHPLQVAVQRSLGVGESLVLLESEESRCNELAQTGGRYLLSVFNTGSAHPSSAAFQLYGAGAAAYAPSLAQGAAPARARFSTVAALPGNAGEPSAHARLLEMNRSLLQRLGSRAPRAGARPSYSRSSAPLAVGDTLRVRVSNINTDRLCENFTTVTARVVYAGSRAVVLEDKAAPLAGQMDGDYQAIGQEVDGRMWGILEGNFGNPLAMDARTDANGKVLMVFSPAVNDLKNVSGFVFSGDLFDPAQCAASNRAEIFYAVVPTSTATGVSSGTREYWNWTIPSTVIHEIKHVTSFAERLSRNATRWEESWLEESTARVSEELWARQIFGYGQKENVAYRASLYCESRPTWAECAGRPLVMRKHFGGLYDYMASNETRTPLGRSQEGDASFYGSGWSLVRWAADHFAASESGFLKALTQETTLSGVESLQARTGKSFAEMLGSWSLAMAGDDYPGFAPASPLLRFPSWNTRDVFAGLNQDFKSTYTSPFPLAVRPVSFGSFAVDVPQLSTGSAAVFDLSGAQTGKQLVALRGAGGATPHPMLLLAIVRVQ